jgi:glycosyltransferase involved in cell wall biosynthesis
MRIAVATHTLARVGGVEAYVEHSVRSLIDAGHDVCVFTEDSQAGRAGGLDVPAWTPSARDPGRTISEAVRAYGADVVIGHGLADPAAEESLAAIHPSVFFAHAYHGTCISGAKAYSFPVVRPCGRTFGAGCLLRYYPKRCGGISPMTMVQEYRKQQQRLGAVQRHDWLFAISEHIGHEYARHGVPSSRIRILPPPVPPAACDDGPRVDPNHVVYIGRLEPLKGPALAVAAVAAAARAMSRPLRLTIAGEGSGRHDVQLAIERLTGGVLGEVRLAGRLDPAGCAELLAGAALLVVPSVWPEPFGLVGLEAAAQGVPVAAFRVGGIPEWLVDGVSGHLAALDPEPMAGLRDAIVLALQDPQHHASLRQGARAAHAAAAARDHIGALGRALEHAVLGIKPS